MFLPVMPPILPVGDVLVDVVAEMATLAEGCEVISVVVFAVPIEVGDGEHHPGKAPVS
jgi:hypothetical protein